MPVSGLDSYPAKKVPSSFTPEGLLALAAGHAFQCEFYGLARRIPFTFRGGGGCGKDTAIFLTAETKQPQ